MYIVFLSSGYYSSQLYKPCLICYILVLVNFAINPTILFYATFAVGYVYLWCFSVKNFVGHLLHNCSCVD